jgi:hypothetical protein
MQIGIAGSLCPIDQAGAIRKDDLDNPASRRDGVKLAEQG